MPGGTLTIVGICVIGGLLVVLGGIGIVRSITRAWRNSLLGQIMNGVKQEVREGKVGPEDFKMNQVFSSPKSVSDLSEVLTPRINRDFPDLNLSEMRSAVQAVLVKSMDLLMQMTTSGNGDTIDRIQAELAACGIGVTRSLSEELWHKVESARAEGKTFVYRDVIVHKSGINEYQKTSSTVEITFQYSIQCLQYQERNGKFISGNRATPTQTRYNAKVINILDADRFAREDIRGVGFTCPHCGAAVKHLGTDVCSFCGTAIKTVDMRIWLVDKLVEI
ncbi:MAG: hypothetical protein J5636_04535 [Clostridiales bacterium]|nr:hypothetical protein [Clostridiales bacterium]